MLELCLSLGATFVGSYNTKITRWTRQLKVIVDVIYSSEVPLTADEIFMIAKREVPKISLGTVYRNLSKLVAEGLISESDKGGVHAYFRHPFPNTYFQCIECDRLFLVPYHLSIFELSKAVGMNVFKWDLNLKGICRECEEKCT